MRLIKILIFLGIIFLTPCFCLPGFAADAPAQINGVVKEMRVEDAGMNFYFLITQDGKQIFLGAPFEVNEDASKKCVSQSEENESEVTLTGILVKDGDEYSFLDNKFTCVN